MQTFGSKKLTEKGIQSPLAHGLAKATPWAIAAYGGKKAYESQPAQKLRYKWALHKQRKAMARAQRGY